MLGQHAYEADDIWSQRLTRKIIISATFSISQPRPIRRGPYGAVGSTDRTVDSNAKSALEFRQLERKYLVVQRKEQSSRRGDRKGQAPDG